MTRYLYRCPNPDCTYEHVDHRRGDRLDLGMLCPQCQSPGPLRRRFSVSVHRPMQEHMNTTTGTPISSMRQFRDKLKQQSDEQSARTGIEAKYVPVDHDAVRAPD
jgi:hypothetical protein